MDRPHPRSKRSRVAPAALLGVAFAVSACDDASIEAQVFPDLETCENASLDIRAEFTAEDCARVFAEALEEHERSAPRYADADLCAEQHGGECAAVEREGGGSFFMPLMMGYMAGSLLSRGGAAGVKSQPLYKTSAGRFSTPSSSAILPATQGVASVRPAAFQPAPTTARSAPMTRAAVRATGGFGASRSSGGLGRALG